MFVTNNKLLGDDQEMIHEVEQPIDPNKLIEEKENLKM